MAWLKERFGVFCMTSYFFSVMLLYASAQEDFRKPDNLKTYTVKVFQIPPEGGQEIVAYHSVQEYDEQGNITNQTIFAPGGEKKVVFSCENKYDAENRLTEVIRKDSGGELQAKAVTKYGEKKSRTVTTENFLNDEIATLGVQTYDNDGKLTEEKIDNKLYGVSGERVYQYGDDGKLKRMLQKYGTHTKSTVYNYDDKGRVAGVTVLGADAQQLQRHSYKWTDKGDIEEVSQFDPDDARVFKMTYTYKLSEQGYATEALGAYFAREDEEATSKARIVWEYEFHQKK